MDGAQNIKLRVAGKEFQLKANTPEQERAMRLAAEEVNSYLEHYDRLYPGQSLSDKLVFVSLNAVMSKLGAQGTARDLASEAEKLESEFSDYLTGINKA